MLGNGSDPQGLPICRHGEQDSSEPRFLYPYKEGLLRLWAWGQLPEFAESASHVGPGSPQAGYLAFGGLFFPIVECQWW